MASRAPLVRERCNGSAWIVQATGAHDLLVDFDRQAAQRRCIFQLVRPFDVRDHAYSVADESTHLAQRDSQMRHFENSADLVDLNVGMKFRYC